MVFVLFSLQSWAQELCFDLGLCANIWFEKNRLNIEEWSLSFKVAKTSNPRAIIAVNLTSPSPQILPIILHHNPIPPRKHPEPYPPFLPTYVIPLLAHQLNRIPLIIDESAEKLKSNRKDHPWDRVNDDRKDQEGWYAWGNWWKSWLEREGKAWLEVFGW